MESSLKAINIAKVTLGVSILFSILAILVTIFSSVKISQQQFDEIKNLISSEVKQ